MDHIIFVLSACLIGAACGQRAFLLGEERTLRSTGDNSTRCNLTGNLVGTDCSGDIPVGRYTYNKYTKKCEYFVPLSCSEKPNENNFPTRKECFETCMRTSACLLPERGRRIGLFSAFTYNIKDDICKSIKYTIGKDFWPKYNKFETEEQCRSECTPRRQ
uniref:Putative tick kunitz 1 n=1 Tax=Amblyomma triste TaxID=251400 RepID=A0A023G9U3_AMBTT